MTFVAQELTTFSNKGSTLKTYSISIIPRCDPSKILQWITGWETLL